MGFKVTRKLDSVKEGMDVSVQRVIDPENPGRGTLNEIGNVISMDVNSVTFNDGTTIPVDEIVSIRQGDDYENTLYQ